MKLLLDTHILLWALSDDPRLGTDLRAALEAPEAALYVSSVSVWEIAIKRALGKLTAPADLLKTAKAAGCQPLAITWEHAERAGGLPAHHADPFDRLLIAQSQCENLPLVSKDTEFQKYELRLVS